ncbi:sigma-70 family RNA polymerase sigma factor [bacterium]|nr:sigma-70 family RNA polymerase sigma factor [bacterium]
MEKQLIHRVLQGESAAFRDLVEQNQEKIYYLSLDLTGNHHDAEDLSQEVFIKAYRNLDQFRGESSFSSWLYKIAVNTNINRNRKKMTAVLKRSTSIEHAGDSWKSLSPDTNPEKQTDASLLRTHIDTALDRLSRNERCVFVLKHYQEFPLQEIALIMDVSVGTVKSTLFRAVRKMRKELASCRGKGEGEPR